jgi:hypothetical protein
MSPCRLSRPLLLVTLLASTAALPLTAHAEESREVAQPALEVTLDTAKTVDTACRLTFAVENRTGADIARVVFETVVFDSAGSVALLSLLDFKDLPTGPPLRRSFDLPGTDCAALTRVLISGVNTCDLGGAESTACTDALRLSHRTELELLG